MDYHHRFDRDGNCETICTRCFETLGRSQDPATIKFIEARHLCSVKSDRESGSWTGAAVLSNSAEQRRVGLWHVLKSRDPSITLLLVLSIVVCFYVLPTVVEWEMLRYSGVWVASILFGDLIGCSFLSLGLGLRKTGVGLYAILTACKECLYLTRFVPPNLLVWFGDIGPTLAAIGVIAFVSLMARPGGATNTA